MGRLILQRLFFALLTMVLVSIIAFVATEALPGDACTAYLGRDATEEGLAICRDVRQINRPIYVKYAEWVTAFVQGDFGTSMLGDRDIGEIVGLRLRNTAILTAVSAIAIELKRINDYAKGIAKISLVLNPVWRKWVLSFALTHKTCKKTGATGS